MKNQRFKLNLPSIPGKSIRFRIDSIKLKGFMGKQQRFKANKKQLINDFIQSFENLQQAPDNIDQDDKITQQTRTTFKQINKKQESFRYVMPQYKNTLVELLQRQQIQMKQRSGLVQSKDKVKNRPIHIHDRTNSVIQKLTKNKEQENQTKKIMEEYYTKQKQQFQKRKIQKSLKKPSAVFVNQPRKVLYKRQQNSKNQIPGPGFYETKFPNTKQNQKKKKHKKDSQESQQGLENLKRQTKKIFEKHNIQLIQQNQLSEEFQMDEKPKQPNYMFIKDDRNRYGEQIFPIVLKLNVPGPGAYNVIDTIQDKAKKIVILQQQRKLLKDWFNQ